MIILVNNTPAKLKANSSFEYISENRLFSGADGYTLTITFPLKDCPENNAIFGHINRMDVIASKVAFDCEIHDVLFVKKGSIAITEINDAEVKAQFLEGRSEQNFNKTFDDIYINELDLGRWPVTTVSNPQPAELWSPHRKPGEPHCVALPWVNDQSGNLQNPARLGSDGEWHWWSSDGSNSSNKQHSFQPYLLWITEKICEAVGYNHDFASWRENKNLEYILICNTLPAAWDVPEFARALPHWSVSEYFEKLELFLDGEFDIDHRSCKITFRTSGSVTAAAGKISLTEVVDEYTSELSLKDPKCEYIRSKNIKFADQGFWKWKYYSCDWFVDSWRKFRYKEFDTLEELLAYTRDCKVLSSSNRHRDILEKISTLYYVRREDMHFVIRSYAKEQIREPGFSGIGKFDMGEYNTYMHLIPANLFGPQVNNDADDADELDVEFVPVPHDGLDGNLGCAMFLDPGAFDEPQTGDVFLESGVQYALDFLREERFQSAPTIMLSRGETDKRAEYYDKIFVGMWDGSFPKPGTCPFPATYSPMPFSDWTYVTPHVSMRINDRHKNANKPHLAKIDPKRKTTFKFLSNEIPDVRAEFHIRGQRYICEKITATFTENGMFRLLKGEFYPIKD